MNRPSLLVLLLVVLLLAACQPIQPQAAPDISAPETTALPAIIDYNLGDDTLVEDRLPETSRFREMPVRLNGVIAVPETSEAAPVVLILHGTHPGCPETRHMVDEWPCAPEDEQRNYAGWGWLAQQFAAAGYVALAPNINAEYTFGFGEPTPGVRLQQLVDKHLDALAAASAGEADAPDFGVDVAGKADLSRLILVGHSRGAGEAFRIIRTRGLDGEPIAGQSYGPALGLLAITPAPTVLDEEPLALPLAVVLAGCDGDVVGQDGQWLYESLRFAPDQQQWALSLWLESATHNAFNDILGADLASQGGTRPSCGALLDAQTQRDWMARVALDFAAVALNDDAAALARLGGDVTQPAPTTLYGLPARTAFLPAAANRLLLLAPTAAADLEAETVTTEGLALQFCRAGFVTPDMEPGSEPCRRVNFTIPGRPAMAVATWEQPGAALRLALPQDSRDLSTFAALSLRLALDPLSALNAAGQPQALTLQITDGAGATATLLAPADAPELAFPEGEAQSSEWLADGFFTAPVPLTTLRMPLASFAGVDLSDVAEVALLFDQTQSGVLFVADVELVR